MRRTTASDLEPLPLDAETAAIERRARGVLRQGVASVAAILLLTALFEIKEVAVARGALVPLAPEVSVEHLEGGRVADLLVEEGDTVFPGTVLLRIAPVQAQSDLAQVQSRLAALLLTRERLRALLAGRSPDFAGTAPGYDAFAAEQRALFRAETEAHAAERAAIAAETAELDAARAAAEREIESASRRISIAEAQEEMQAQLFDRGHGSRTRVLAASGSVSLARSAVAEAERTLAGTLRALAEAGSRAERLEVETQRRRTERIAEISHEIVALEARLAQETDRVERLTVVSPIRGILHELTPRGRGEILVAGERVARIVPLGERLVAEVRVSPSDIGHVKPGDPAEITVDTFDPEVFGEITARVDRISPSTIETARDELFYKVRLAIDGDDAPRLASLLPGMTLEARIVTGSKSILRYLTKPVLEPVERAFSER